MAERLKNSGFWSCRFLISPEELEQWTNYATESLEIVFNGDSDKDSKLNSSDICKLLLKNYHLFYEGLMSPNAEERRTPFMRVWLTKDGFNSHFYTQITHWYFDPPKTVRVGRDFFLQLLSPKGFQIDCSDGIHYEYHDIHEKEPNAKSLFDELCSPIKKMTKPLQVERFGKLVPEYQIRISEQAWIDLTKSAFYRGPGQLLASKW